MTQGTAGKAIAVLIALTFIVSIVPPASDTTMQTGENVSEIPAERTRQVQPETRNSEFRNYGWSNGEFTNYYGEPEIQAMEYDEKRDVLYLGTTYGLMIYNLTSEEKAIKTAADGLPANNIISLELNQINDVLYIGTDGLSVFNLITGSFTNKYMIDGLINNVINALQFDSVTNKLYIGTNGGLSIYDIQNDTFVNKTTDNGLPSNVINSLALDKTDRKQLYVGTWGLSIYDIPTNTFSNRNTSHGLPSNSINSLLLNPTGDILYIGTKYSEGSETSWLSIYNLSSDIFTNHDAGDVLPKGDIQALEYDSTNNVVYIGVDVVYQNDCSGGFSIFNPTTELFDNKTISNGLPSNRVLSLIFNDNENRLYVGTSYYWDNGTYGSGLSIYNIPSNTFTNKVLGDGLPSNGVSHALFDSSTNRIYIGTDRSLTVFDIFNNTSTIKNHTNGLIGDYATYMAFDDIGKKLFISTLKKGFSIYNISMDTFVNKNTIDGLSHNLTRDLEFDKNRNLLYIATAEGLNIFNVSTGSFTYRNTSHGLPVNDIKDLQLNENKDMLYIGMASGGGLSIYNLTTDTFINRGTSNGLVSGTTFGLELDSPKGKLYIGTFGGLSIYDINNDTFENEFLDEIIGRPILYDNNHLFLYRNSNPSLPSELIIYNLTSDTYFIKNTKDGAPDNGLYPCFYNDEYKILCLATNSGLSFYDPTFLSPPILSPLPSQNYNGNYTLSWSSLWNADIYTLEESNNTDFLSPSVLYHGPNTSYDAINKIDAVYYYRVRANNSGGNSDWSNIVNLSVVRKPTSPILNSLTSPDIDGNYTVSWTTIFNADNYTLEEDNNSYFSSPTTIYMGKNTTFTIINKTNGTYFYRVKATNIAGNSSWSNVENVTVSTILNGNGNNNGNDNCFILSVAIVTILILVSILLFLNHNRKKKKVREEENDDELEGNV